jgi:hypothetical protein
MVVRFVCWYCIGADCLDVSDEYTAFIFRVESRMVKVQSGYVDRRWGKDPGLGLCQQVQWVGNFLKMALFWSETGPSLLPPVDLSDHTPVAYNPTEPSVYLVHEGRGVVILSNVGKLTGTEKQVERQL